jgi:hypothetical protein
MLGDGPRDGFQCLRQVGAGNLKFVGRISGRRHVGKLPPHAFEPMAQFVRPHCGA